MTGSRAAALAAAAATSDVEVRKEIVLDWRDGPLEGFLSVVNPSSHWHFRMIAANEAADDVDDRLFALAPIGDILMGQVLDSVVADDTKVIEVPDPSTIDDAMLDNVLNQVGPPELLAVLNASHRFERIWVIEPGTIIRKGH